MNEYTTQTILNYPHYQCVPTVLNMCIPRSTRIAVTSEKEQARKSKFLRTAPFPPEGEDAVQQNTFLSILVNLIQLILMA